jgi:outer membrane protein OmpA-like peptidoglycan-associated protein
MASDAAEANPEPETGSPTCGLTQAFQITGFNENSNELTPKIAGQLDAVIKAIGTQKCAVRITGYSSPEGDYAHNALFSIERAQNTLHYLSDRGVKFRRYSANGVGETRQFGPAPSANRRVVVRVSP